jgi:hypothetical protein
MILRFRIGKIRFTFTVAPVIDVVGVNSNVSKTKHILMWDFDGTNLGTVLDELSRIQRIYKLPPIWVFETKKGKNFIAYCFKKCKWREAVEIIAATKGVDWGFFKYGVYREHFTLRVSEKRGKRPELIAILDSPVKPDVTIRDLRSWTKYETLDD